MILYTYNRDGVFTGERVARVDPAMPTKEDGSINHLIPLHSTMTPPPECGVEEIQIFDATTGWGIFPNVMGKTIYLKSDGSASICKEYKVPDGFTLIPPSDFSSWNESIGAWIYDREKHLVYIRRKRDSLLFSCDWTQLPDAPLTDEQKALWVSYRQKLRDYPEGDITAPWPTTPE